MRSGAPFLPPSRARGRSNAAAIAEATRDLETRRRGKNVHIDFFDDAQKKS
ncbi:MAG: hypothetical protein NXH97_01540 [Rhodobacteraceae bacterium]|nr:hypothetical protein [Paracoccaceae bacterium]